MTWDIELAPTFQKQIKTLDKPIATQINKALLKLSRFPDPHKHCKALTGPFKGLWRYRASKDYRLIVDIDRGRMVVVALEVEHRSVSYRHRPVL